MLGDGGPGIKGPLPTTYTLSLRVLVNILFHTFLVMFSAPSRLSFGLPLEDLGKAMPWTPFMTLILQGGGGAQDITMALKSVLRL